MKPPSCCCSNLVSFSFKVRNSCSWAGVRLVIASNSAIRVRISSLSLSLSD
ncbi:MAG: hypothetical protein NY202_02025 [Mollicutes bacterium UO1]